MALRAARATRRRLFFALWPDAQCRERLELTVVPLLQQVPARALSPLDWHVTLCFLGAVEPLMLAELQAGVGRIHVAPFVLTLDRVRYWRGAGVIAATAACAPPAAVRLADALRALARSLGLVPDDKPLRPHVTLMRGVSGALWRLSPASRQAGGVALTLELAAADFHLAESLAAEGERRYASVARWPLRG